MNRCSRPHAVSLLMFTVAALPVDRFKVHTELFISESKHLLDKKLPTQRNSDLVTNKISSEYLKGLDSELIVEWGDRGHHLLGAELQIKAPFYKGLLLKIEIDKFLSNVFLWNREQIKDQQTLLQRLLLKTGQNYNLGEEYSCWIKWLQNTESTDGLSCGSLFSAVTLYLANSNESGLTDFKTFLEIRYYLNSERNNRVFLEKFDNVFAEKWLAYLQKKDSRFWNDYYQKIDDFKYLAQRKTVSKNWFQNLRDAENAEVAEKIWSLYLADRVALGEGSDFSEVQDLVKIRVKLGMGQESLIALNRWAQLEPPIYFWHYYKARALENLAKSQSGDSRQETLSWAQEHYRIALNENGLMSQLRDELLEKYASLLRQRNYLTESGEIWETLFKAGLNRESRLNGLKNRIHTLCDLSENLPTLKVENFRQAVSLAGFLANSGFDSGELKYVASRLRKIRRKLDLMGDLALEASLLEVEKLSKKGVR